MNSLFFLVHNTEGNSVLQEISFVFFILDFGDQTFYCLFNILQII